MKMSPVSHINSLLIQRRIFLTLFFVLLFAVCWRFGMAKIADWHGPGGTLSNELYLPAIMMNAGHGFSVTDSNVLPELRAFLSLETDTFDPTSLPADISLKAPESTYLYHKNLIYLVAFVWRVMGVSWHAVKVLLILLLFLSAMLVYAISRLALPRTWSYMVALAFVLNDAVLMSLYTLRDFSKAPFILFVILMLGLAIKHRLPPRRYLLVALGIGVILGIGMGFRRDMLAILPLSLFILLGCRIQTPARPVATRLAAALIMTVAFIMLGWPALRSLYPERSINAHDMIMGFASVTDAEAGLIAPASYEKHFVHDDQYSTCQVFGSAELGFSVDPRKYEDYRTTMPWNEYEYFLKRSYVLFIARTFPADMLTRAYAAVLRTVIGIHGNRIFLFRLFERCSILFMIISFLIIAAASPYQAWQLLAMLAFFGGYTSLQYGQRHAFHITFAGYFFCAFTLYNLYRAACFARKQPSVAAIIDILSERRREMARSGIWILLAFLLFFVPLKVAQAMQYRTVHRLYEAYRQAPRSELPFKMARWEGNTLFVPADDFPCSGCEIEQESHWWFRTRVLAARFKPGNEPIKPTLAYEWDFPGPEFRGTGIVHTRHGIDAGYIDYYFVVHLTNSCRDWNRFAGLLLPDNQADRFEGFQEITDLKGLGGLFHITVPENSEAFVYTQKLHIPWPHTFPGNYDPGNPPYHFQEDGDIKRLLSAGNFAEAASAATAMLARRPNSIQFNALLIEALLKNDDNDDAHEIIDRLRKTYPDDYALYARLERCFERVGGIEARYENWRRITATDDECAVYYWERAQSLHQDSDGKE